jgi:hypothetical protein
VAAALTDGLEEAGEVVGLGGVGADAGRVAVDLRQRLVDRLLAAPGQVDGRALGGEARGDREADPAGPAGDDGDLLGEFLGHLVTPSVGFGTLGTEGRGT